MDAHGAVVESDEGIRVVLGGAQIGVLVPGPGAVGGSPVADVAADAAVLVEVVRLRLELSGALRDVESSRTRLVQAAHEERRRLERDLHDGAQQRLVSLGMAIRLAQRHLADGTVDVHGLLDQAVAELGTAVAELRRLAHGVRPVGLDDGLREALVTLTQGPRSRSGSRSTPIDVSDELATTAYYVASEAVANAIKHADPRASTCRLPGPMASCVSGSRTMAAAARRGVRARGWQAWPIESRRSAARFAAERAGSGTVVEAVLPCAS